MPERDDGMQEEMNTFLKDAIKDFKLPRYNEIPNVGLYLEQTAKYISEMSQTNEMGITGSMISNYVKRELISKPVKKQYNREQIAYLIFIAIVKNILAMEDFKLIFSIQKRTYTSQVAYDYFCSEFENILDYIFGRKNVPDMIGVDNSDVKIMLRNTITAVAYKIYLDKLFSVLRKSETNQCSTSN